MTLLAPWALWFSIVGAAVLALYLLKIRRHPRTVPSLDFWRSLVRQRPARSLFRQLKRWLSLLLWLAIAGLLVLSLGNPVLSLGRLKPESIALVVDTSASMQAAEAGGKTRLDLAREAVRELLDRRPVDDEWMLVEAGRSPRVLQAFTRDRRAVRDAAAAVEPHLGEADLAGAVELARQLLDGRERPRIVIVSDGAAGAVEKLVDREGAVLHWPVGQAEDNLGIARLGVRAHRQQAAYHVFVRVVGASAQPVQAQLVLEIDGAAVKVEPFTVEPGGAWEKTDVLQAPEGGVLRAWIDRPDALAADNEAHAVLEPVRPVSVLLATRPKDAFFFEQALLAMEPLVDPKESRTVAPEDLPAAGAVPRTADLAVFNDCAPPSAAVPPACVFVNSWPADLPARVTGEISRPDMILSKEAHALTRYLNVGAASLARAKKVDLVERATVLAQSSRGEPLIFLVERSDRRALCLAFDVLESDLPFRNAFPLLLRNAVTYFVADRDRWVRDQYLPGEVIEPLRPLPPGTAEVRVTRLLKGKAEAETVPARGGSFAWDRTQRPGPLQFAVGEERAWTAVNAAIESESRIRPLRAGADPATRLELSARLAGASPWAALAAAAALLIALEWLSYHARWTE